jgi:hypothetical protein
VRPPVTGQIDLNAQVEGTGLSPNALISSLDGGGTLSLRAAQFASLDPKAFAAVMRAADQGLPIDGIRVADFMSKALDRGSLPVRHAKAGLRVIGGQIRLQEVSVEPEGASLSLSGNLDLMQGALEARLALSGGAAPAGGGQPDQASDQASDQPSGQPPDRPDVFLSLRGPLAAPARNIDVSALTGWLTLRAVDQQAKKLEAIERERARERQLELERMRARERQRELDRARASQPAQPPELSMQQPVQQPAQLPATGSAAIVPPVLVPPGLAPSAAAPSSPQPERAPPLPAPQTIAPAPQPGGQMTTQSTSQPKPPSRPQPSLQGGSQWGLQPAPEWRMRRHGEPGPATPLQLVPQN